MTKARDLANLGNKTSLDEINDAYDAGGLSNRNSIINSNFTIWQRGTSFSSSGYGADRWSYATSGGAGVHSRQAFTGSDIDTFGTQYFHRLAVSTGANNQGMSTLLEDLSRFAGKTVTLSFYAKGTNPAGGHLTTLIGGETGSGGSGDWEVGGTNEIVLSSSWQKFTVTMTLPSMNGRTLGTGSYLFVYLARQPNDDNTTNAWTIDMSQVQLELGDTATPFEHRSYGDELAACQRYCYVIQQENNSVNANASACNGTYYSPTSFYGVLVFPTTMRVPPTMAVPTVTNGYRIYSATGADLRDGTNFDMQSINKDNLCIYVPDVSSTAGFGGWMELIVAGAKFTFDAEF